MVNLSNKNLHEVSKLGIDVPTYDRTALKSGIFHIGPSAFFRAHLAVFADNLLNECEKNGKPLDWGITAVSMNRPNVRDALAAQDHLYTLTSKGKDNANMRVIGSVRDIMVAPEDPDAAIEAAAHEDVKIISLTVTQQGYYYDAATGGLDVAHPDIQNCLDSESDFVSSIGLIVAALDLRRQRNMEPPIILSCDNLEGNGKILRNDVLAYAGHISSDLKNWIEQKVKFPDTMVDRITPKTTDEHTALLTQCGIQDNWGVQAEPMPLLPFVIECDLTQPVPPAISELASKDRVIITNDTFPYETLKVRTLNGAHMALGCIGHQCGYEHTHEAMADSNIREFAIGFMEEVGKTIKPTDGITHDDFRKDLLDRLDNPQICDQLTRLCRNGVSKVPSRFLNTIRDLKANEGNNSFQHLAFSLAAWINYMGGLDENGYLPGAGPNDEPNDKAAADIGLIKLAKSAIGNPGAIFAERQIFGKDLAAYRELQIEVTKNLAAIQNKGMRTALHDFMQAMGSNPALGVNNTGSDTPTPTNDSANAPDIQMD